VKIHFTSVPSSSNTVSDGHSVNALTELNNVSDYFVTWDTGQTVRSHVALLKSRIGMADTAGKDFDENLAGSRSLQLDIDDLQGRTRSLDDGSLVSGRKGNHCCCGDLIGVVDRSVDRKVD
jgi:hypothetical protein